MQTFIWSPTLGETLEQFNERIAKYAGDTIVLDITPSVVGDTLILVLTEIDDVPVEAASVLIPQVITLTDPELTGLNRVHPETTVEALLKVIRDRDTDEEPSMPFKTVYFPRASGGAYGVVLVNGGEIDVTADAGPGRPDPEDGGGAIPPRVRR